MHSSDFFCFGEDLLDLKEGLPLRLRHAEHVEQVAWQSHAGKYPEIRRLKEKIDIPLVVSETTTIDGNVLLKCNKPVSSGSPNGGWENGGECFGDNEDCQSWERRHYSRENLQSSPWDSQHVWTIPFRPESSSPSPCSQVEGAPQEKPTEVDQRQLLETRCDCCHYPPQPPITNDPIFNIHNFVFIIHPCLINSADIVLFFFHIIHAALKQIPSFSEESCWDEI